MGFFEKGILLYLFLAIACIFWQPNLIFNDAHGRTPISWFGINQEQFVNGDANDVYGFNLSSKSQVVTDFSDPTLQSETNNENQRDAGFLNRGREGGNNIFLTVVDGLYNVMGFISVAFKMLFAPFIVFGSLVIDYQAPSVLIILIAVPLVIMFLVGVAMFIRGIV